MEHRAIAPPEALRAWVRSIDVIEDTSSSARTFRIIADGCPGLNFQQGVSQGGSCERSPQLLVHGIATRHAHKRSFGPFVNIHLQFQPQAVYPLFGIAAHRCTDTAIDLRHLVDTDLLVRCTDAPSHNARVALLCAFLQERVERSGARKEPSLDGILGPLQAPSSVEGVRRPTGASQRSVARLFERHVGVPMRTYARMMRFQHTLGALREQRYAKLSDVAYGTGYADQSHFIRDFQRFTGASPLPFLRHANEVVENLAEWRA